MGIEINSEDAILEMAAEWHARLGAPGASEDDRARCELWRRQNPAHEEAFANVERFSSSFAQHAATDPRLQLMAQQAFAMGARDVPRRGTAWRRWQLPVTLAAGIAIAVMGIRFGASRILGAPETAYFTASGEHRDINLADGSVVHLDIASNIRVKLSQHERQVELVAGRAFFEVAHDASRPFTVTASGEHVTALGTRFQVERQQQFVLVTLAEGSVAVFDEPAAAAPHRETLHPGEQLKIGLDDGAWTTRTIDTQAATSWSLGRLIFRATPLAEALDEVNRYAGKKVRLGDTSLATLPVSGNFISGDSTLAVSAITAVLPVRAVDAGHEIVLFRRQGTAPPLDNHGG